MKEVETMTYSDYRRVARENLQGNWPLSIGVAALAWLLGGILVGNAIIPQFTFHFRGEDLSLKDWLDLVLSYTHTYGNSTVTFSFLSLAQFILGGVVQLGYARYLLNQHNKANFEFRDLFSQFDRFGQGFAQSFLRSLYITLWTLLFIIPGIVKGYAYAMTPFIMAENPDMTANEAITASRALMDGHKGELFMLDLSFIGWDILAALTLNLGHLALNPYRNAAHAAFYKDITA